MKKLIFAVSPDYIPKHYVEWHRLNMTFQRDLGISVELQMPTTYTQFHRLVVTNRPQIVFSGSFHAVKLMQECGYRPLVKPLQRPDEVVIICRKDSEVKNISALHKNAVFAALVNSGVECIGLRLLEAANLDKDTLRWRSKDHFQAVVRMVRDGEADAGLIRARVFDELHPFIRDGLRVLVRSVLNDISHLFLVYGDHDELYQRLSTILVNSRKQTRYYPILRALNCHHGFKPLQESDGVLLTDIVDALQD